MNDRMQDTFSAASDAWRFVQKNWPFAARTSPLAFAAVAGLGLAAGIAAGMLFAPQTGTELRASLAGKARGALDQLGTKVEGLGHSASELASAAGEKVEEAVLDSSSGRDHRSGSSNDSSSRRHGKHHARA